MEILPVKTAIVHPPQDDLLARIREANFKPREDDVIAVTSKVVSIWQGRCVPAAAVPDKDALIKKEAEWFLDRRRVPGEHVIHTLKEHTLIPSAGIDASNADGHYILWPKEPQKTAFRMLRWFKKTYRCRRLGLIITDSHSAPFRRGTLGFALAWTGFEPLYDYRGAKDLFGRELSVTQANVADALAAAAVLLMGEGSEQTPLAIIRGAARVGGRKSRRSPDAFQVPLKEDLFAPFFQSVPWQKGGTTAQSGT